MTNWESYVETAFDRISLMVQWLGICFLMQRQRFHPYSGKVPHAKEHLSWGPQLLKPACLEPVLSNERSDHDEKSSYCNQRVGWTLSLQQQEKAHCSSKDPAQPKINKTKVVNFRKKETVFDHGLLKCRWSYSPRTPDNSILWNMRVREHYII